MSVHNVADSSRATYETNLKTYRRVMAEELGVDPEPISIDKMRVFIIWMKRKGRTYNTLIAYVRAFSWYFRTNRLDWLTQDGDFKLFLSGLRREMTKVGSDPNAKSPFPVEWFDRIVEARNMEDVQNRELMFCMTLSFHAFLRISELLNLRRKDIIIDETEEKMELNVSRSKTCQYARGEKTFIFKTRGASSPWHYRDVLERMDGEDFIVGENSEHQLRRKLATILREIGVEDVSKYSFHSFRRGGAHLASARGVNGCVIKAHGRWRSEAYQRYVVVDKWQAGKNVAGALDV